MSRYYSGRDGALFHAPVPEGGSLLLPLQKVAKCTQWSFTTSADMLDTTALGDTETTVVPGLRSHSGSCKILYYVDNTGANTASDILHSLLAPRLDNARPEVAQVQSQWRLHLRVNNSETDFKRIGGPVWITRASLTMAVGQIFGMDLDFVYDGAPISVTI